MNKQQVPIYFDTVSSSGQPKYQYSSTVCTLQTLIPHVSVFIYKLSVVLVCSSFLISDFNSNLFISMFQTCWLTLWVTPCRTLTCSPTANSSTTTSICPSPSMALHLPPPPLPPPPLLPPHTLIIFRITTVRTAWRPPAIPRLRPTARDNFRATGSLGYRWGGGRGRGWGGRAEVKTSCVWCVAIKHQGITTTRSPARDAKVHLVALCALYLDSEHNVWSFVLLSSPGCCRFLQTQCDQKGCVSLQEWRWLRDGHVHEEEVSRLPAEEVPRGGNAGWV